MHRPTLIASVLLAALAVVLFAAPWATNPESRKPTADVVHAVGDAQTEGPALTRSELLATLSSETEELKDPTFEPEAPALSLPAPRPMPFSDVLNPQTFDELWVISDDTHGYSANAPQYFLAHTHTRGGAIGNAVNDAALAPGSIMEIAGVRYDVITVSTIAKPEISGLPIWQATDPGDAFLIVCQYNHGSLATHNLVIELYAEGSGDR